MSSVSEKPEAKETVIGDNIAKLRKKRGISQAELRRLTGANIWRIEHGYFTPTVSTVQKIAEALDTTASALLKE